MGFTAETPRAQSDVSEDGARRRLARHRFSHLSTEGRAGVLFFRSAFGLLDACPGFALGV
jgi:hypothetical protein